MIALKRLVLYLIFASVRLEKCMLSGWNGMSRGEVGTSSTVRTHFCLVV
jgi:hypothetical protein